jgi:hypothetical protein
VVTDINGQPIEGALLGPVSDFGLERPKDDQRTVKTDQNGRFTYQPGHETHGLCCWSDGYVPVARYQDDDASHHFTFQLPLAGRLEITDFARGMDSDRWSLRFEYLETGVDLGAQPITGFTTTFSPRGKQTIENLPVGRYIVHFWKQTDDDERPANPAPGVYLRESIAIAAHETTILRVSEFWRR